MTSALRVSHRSTVTPDQIDHLGHMNVRFYGLNARAGTDAVLDELGGMPRGHQAMIDDTHTHQKAEQLKGARLHVRSGVIGADEQSVRLYHELVNDDTDVIAATFIHRVRVVRNEDYTPAPVPPSLVDAAVGRVTEIPAHGRPRTLDLSDDPATWAPSPQLLLELDLHAREPRTILTSECDDTGYFPPDNPSELTWGGVPRTDHPSFMFFSEGPKGERLAWAVLESRSTVHRLPRAGDRVQSFSALREIGNKTTRRMQWVLDLDRGDLLVGFEVVDICFDLNERKACVIPDFLRDHQRNTFHPELYPA